MPDGRILIVEDETLVAMDLERGLRAAGYEVVAVVDSGEAAIEAAKTIAPDLILMDIMLKGPMDGIEAAGRIRAMASIPVVFLTAYADSATVGRAKAVTPHGYLSKPYDERELHRVVSLALARAAEERAERERAARALWESEERFQMLVEAVTDYALILVDAPGRIAAWNAGAERLFGWSAEEIVGERFDRLYPPAAEGEASLESELEELRARGRVEVEAWRVRRDGTRIWVRAVRTAVRDEQGRLRGFATVVQDLTRRRELETQLHRAQRFDAIGKLAGGIAHDFNNMLMVVLSRADDLLRLAGDRQPERRYIENIRQAALRSSELTRQLLATARREVLRPVVVDLSELVAATLRLLERSIGEDIRIVTELEKAPWKIRADPSKIHQVLLNLALNARDAMAGGGVLTVETRNFHADSVYAGRHPGIVEGDYEVLLVSDTGCGIVPEDLDRIWEPFFTTKQIGSGLGLSVVRGVVEQMGGQVWTYSEPGEGTTFKLYFPRYTGSEVAKGDPEPEATPTRGEETILVVEDEALLRAMVRDALEECGYRVLEAPDPKSALAIEEEHAGTIDLLLTDVVMPGMDGRELALRLHEKRPALAVIYMSGYPGNAITNAHDLEPGAHFLEKPISSTRLLREIRNCLDARNGTA